MLYFVVTHTYEHYGNLVTYMRLKNIVPPSSEPAEAGAVEAQWLGDAWVVVGGTNAAHRSTCCPSRLSVARPEEQPVCRARRHAAQMIERRDG